MGKSAQYVITVIQKPISLSLVHGDIFTNVHSNRAGMVSKGRVTMAGYVVDAYSGGWCSRCFTLYLAISGGLHFQTPPHVTCIFQS